MKTFEVHATRVSVEHSVGEVEAISQEAADEGFLDFLASEQDPAAAVVELEDPRHEAWVIDEPLPTCCAKASEPLSRVLDNIQVLHVVIISMQELNKVEPLKSKMTSDEESMLGGALQALKDFAVRNTVDARQPSDGASKTNPIGSIDSRLLDGLNSRSVATNN